MGFHHCDGRRQGAAAFDEVHQAFVDLAHVQYATDPLARSSFTATSPETEYTVGALSTRCVEAEGAVGGDTFAVHLAEDGSRVEIVVDFDVGLVVGGAQDDFLAPVTKNIGAQGRSGFAPVV